MKILGPNHGLWAPLDHGGSTTQRPNCPTQFEGQEVFFSHTLPIQLGLNPQSLPPCSFLPCVPWQDMYNQGVFASSAFLPHPLTLVSCSLMPPGRTIKELFVRPVEDPLVAQLAVGKATCEGAADSARQQVGAVIKGWMVGQLALTRGREAAEKAVDGMLDEFRAKLLAAPGELAESLPFIYIVLQRAG